MRKVFSKVFAQNKALRTQESVFLISKYDKKKKKKKKKKLHGEGLKIL